MKIPSRLRTHHCLGRSKQLNQLVKWWPESFIKSTIFDLGCKDGEMSWLMSHVAKHVWCWDIGSRCQEVIESYNRPNLAWCSPHHVPEVDTVYLGGVLQNVAILEDPAAFLDRMVPWIAADTWIFREQLLPYPRVSTPTSLYYGEAWPEEYHKSGWQETQQAIDGCAHLSIQIVHEITLPDNLSEATPQRFIKCKKL